MQLKTLAFKNKQMGLSAPGRIQTAVWVYSINLLVDVSAKTISSSVFNEAET